ncbi:hypothetical protein N9L68_07290 [bacterium]|nr:hypothetical protein [bacterium]
MNRLARHGEEHQLNRAYKKVAHKTDTGRGCPRSLGAPADREAPSREAAAKLKEQSRSNKIDTGASRGKSRVSVGSQRPQGDHAQPRSPCFGHPQPEATDVNAFNRQWERLAQHDKGTGQGKGKCGD